MKESPQRQSVSIRVSLFERPGKPSKARPLCRARHNVPQPAFNVLVRVLLGNCLHRGYEGERDGEALESEVTVFVGDCGSTPHGASTDRSTLPSSSAGLIGMLPAFLKRRIMAPGGIAFAGSQFVFAYSARRFQIARSTCGCGRPAERLGWGRSQPMGCATLQRQSSSTRWERICGKSRSYSATRISARQSATPTSATNKHGRLRRHSARRWSEVGNASSGVLLTGEMWRAVR
jgi:hypothetical protein